MNNIAGWLVLLKGEWEWVEDLTCGGRHQAAYEKIFAGLLDSYEWYADVSDLTQIRIGEVEFVPLQESMNLAETWKGWSG